jgi:hypothetical protein
VDSARLLHAYNVSDVLSGVDPAWDSYLPLRNHRMGAKPADIPGGALVFSRARLEMPCEIAMGGGQMISDLENPGIKRASTRTPWATVVSTARENWIWIWIWPTFRDRVGPSWVCR